MILAHIIQKLPILNSVNWKRKMCPNEFQDKSIQLMREFCLYDWKFEYDRAKRRIGCCKYGPKVLSFSLHYVLAKEFNELKNTILHEIAHALVGAANGHNNVWKRKAIEVGARPERCSSLTLDIEKKYILNCNCEVKPGFLRRPKRVDSEFKCGKCKFKGRLVQN